MNNWFTVKVKYTKQLEDGRLKRVSEPYLINSMSFTDAEARAYEEIGDTVRGEFLITNIAKTDYADIFQYDDCDTWFKVKISYVSADADSDKEKKISNNLLVNASNVKEAYDRTQESMKGMMVSFDIPSITLSPIIDIFPFNGEEMDYADTAVEVDDTPEVGFKGATAGVFSASGSDEDEDDELEDEVHGVVEDEYDSEEE